MCRLRVYQGRRKCDGKGLSVSILPKVKTGLDVLVEEKFARLKGKRVAILANPASVNKDLVHIIELVKGVKEIDLVRIFAPEHGLFADAQDQISLEKTGEVNRIPVVNLYGKEYSSLWPEKKYLEDIDILLADIQDIGSRYYTYFHTLAFCMEKAAKTDCTVMVLDRPNPLGCTEIEGPILKNEMQSFVGYFPVPVRCGMTTGELVSYVNSEFDINAKIEIVEMQGYKRSMYFDDTGLEFVMPSPNMPTLNTAIVYPGGCLLEGTNASEGRGTTRPFELFGAPWLNSAELKKRLDEDKLSGVLFRETAFLPTFHKYMKEPCKALQVHVTNRNSFKPWLTYVMILKHIIELHDQFDWYRGVYEYVSDRLAIDLLFGDMEIRKALEAGESREFFEEYSTGKLSGFLNVRKKHLIYS